MAQTNEELATKLGQSTKNEIAPLKFEGELKQWYGHNATRLTTFLGGEESAKFLMASFCEAARRIPRLSECTRDSIFNCLMQAAETGLYPGALSECHFVPYKNEAKFIPDYRGLCKLAYESGYVKAITADVIYSNDEFSYEKGTNSHLSHKIDLRASSRGERIGAWAVVEMDVGGSIIEVQPMSFIEGIKKRSQAARSNFSPWSNEHESDYDAMAKKTMLKQILKTIPKGKRLARAMEIDNEVESGNAATVIDVLPREIDWDSVKKEVAENKSSFITNNGETK